LREGWLRKNRAALEQMRKVLKADITPSTELNLMALIVKAAFED